MQGRRPGPPGSGLVLEVEALDLRVRNAYSGLLDASVALGHSLSTPVVSARLPPQLPPPTSPP